MNRASGETAPTLVDAGGHRLCFESRGSGTPTVVFENGLGVSLEGWAIIQREVARFTRTIAYDRAGLGRSERGRRPVDGLTTVRELHRALRGTGEPGPYVLVGHSLGGVLIRLFTHQYPDEVAGLVFVDPSHPEQLARLPTVLVSRAVSPLLRLASLLARLRIPAFAYLAERGWPKDFPADALAHLRASAASPRHLATAADEYAALDEIFAQGRMAGGLGERPVAVISAGSPRTPYTDTIHGLHRELAALSTRGTHEIVEAATHFSIILERDHARAVVEAIRRVVEATREASAA